MSADYRARALALLALCRRQMGWLLAALEREEDAAGEFENTLDKFWGLLYPETPSSWTYPGEVINHLRAEIERYAKAKAVLQAVAADSGCAHAVDAAAALEGT